MPDEMIASRPLPEITPLTQPFWAAAKARRLVIQRCDACAAYRFPPEPACVFCASPDYTWTEVSGRATLWSWTVGHPPLLPYFAERAPWMDRRASTAAALLRRARAVARRYRAARGGAAHGHGSRRCGDRGLRDRHAARGGL